MHDFDHYIWYCSDEKIARIIAGIERRGVCQAEARSLVNRWRTEGWLTLSLDERLAALWSVVRL